MKAKSSDIENDVTAQQISAEKEDEKNSRAVLFDLEHRRILYRGGGGGEMLGTRSVYARPQNIGNQIVCVFTTNSKDI